MEYNIQVSYAKLGYEDLDCCHLAVDRTHFLSITSMQEPKNSIKCEDFLDQLRDYYLFEDICTFIRTHTHTHTHTRIHICNVMNACIFLCSICVCI